MMGSVPETFLALALSWKTDCLRRCLAQDAQNTLRLTDGGWFDLISAFVPYLAEYEVFGHGFISRRMLRLFATKISIYQDVNI